MKHLNLIALFLFLSCQLLAQDYISSQYLQMTYNIKKNQQTGTAFLITYNGKQYFVTARHLFTTSRNKQSISFEILKDTTWTTINATLLMSDTVQIDIALLQLDSSNYSNRAWAFNVNNELVLGDAGYFLGYPFGLQTKDKNGFNKGFPFPLVKKFVFSGAAIEKGVSFLLLDGHNNPGFSGGPVIFIDRATKDKNRWFIGGVISSYVNQKNQMITPVGLLNYTENSGIIIAISASHIINIINSK
ncbi:MAG: trypsin-like peptidase domain-containing protein [Chitinophagaceae bacterium]|nr:trypsin-like peptidase domain-containing protein [Chitinophagaceae bacterium]